MVSRMKYFNILEVHWKIQLLRRGKGWCRIWLHKTFKIEIEQGGTSNSDFLHNWFCREITSPLFNLSKFKKPEKGTPESNRMHSNLMNDAEFGSLKLLKLNYRRVDQLIQTFCKIGSRQKIDPPALICTKFKTLRKVLLNHVQCIEI